MWTEILAFFMKVQQKLAKNANCGKFSKGQLDNLVDLKKFWKTRIYLQRSVPIQPKTSNILPQICQKLATTPRVNPTSSFRRRTAETRGRTAARTSRRGTPSSPGGRRPSGVSKIGKIIISKFLAGSFSAVSKRNFARKYAFDSIFQALQDLYTFAPLQSQNVSKKSVWKIRIFVKIKQKFCRCWKICKILPIFEQFS